MQQADTRLPYETRLRVRYAETDQMGVVYYANYYVWMELGRVEFVRARGLNYRDLEVNDGLFLAVIESQCRYLAPARYDDEVAVLTWVQSMNARVVEFGYEMRLANTGKVLAKGSTRHMWLSRDWRPANLPDKYRALLGATSGSTGPQAQPEA